MSEKKFEALQIRRGELVQKLRKKVGDPDATPEEREKAKKKLAKYRALLHEQAAAANGPGAKSSLPQTL